MREEKKVSAPVTMTGEIVIVSRRKKTESGECFATDRGRTSAARGEAGIAGGFAICEKKGGTVGLIPPPERTGHMPFSASTSAPFSVL